MNGVLSLHGLAQAWQDFFHAPESPLPLAMFRIAFGVLLVIESLGLWRWGADLFDRGGVRCIGRTRSWTGWFFRMQTLSGLCLALGFATRLAAAFIFVNFCFRTRRNWLVIQGGDNLAKFMSLLIVFSNAGGALSLDRLFHLGWLGGDAEVQSQWPQRVMQIQVSIVYLRTVSWKLRASNWLDGSAVFHALHRNLNLRCIVDRNLFRALLAYSPLAALLTWSTLAGEICTGVFVWFRETRNAALATGILLHLSFELFLSIKQFQWLMLASLMLFLTAQDWMMFEAAFIR